MSLDYNKQNKIHKKSVAIKTLYLIDDNFNTFDHVIDYANLESFGVRLAPWLSLIHI